jgi:hypothetical protein
VGRPALDEQAIRWIEEHNPDIEFDWPKILEAQPPLVPAKESGRPRDEGRNRRPRRDRERPRDAQPQQPVALKEPEATTPGPGIDPGSLELESEPETLEAEPVAEALEQLTHPDAEEEIDPPAMPVEQNLGREQLTRLRARYAELLARIVERGGDSERIEALRTQAESLNPDTWVTDDEVRQGIEAFEPKIRDLRAALGLRRRRRSRRGGRRRRGAGTGNAPLPADTPDSSSNEGE